MARTKQTARTSAKQPTRRDLASGPRKPAGKTKPVRAQPVARKHRWRAGTVALREIKRLQKTTNSLIPKAPFVRLMREVAQEHMDDVRFQDSAIEALREAAQNHLIEHFGRVQRVAIHAKRVTVFNKDSQLVTQLAQDAGDKAYFGANGLPDDSMRGMQTARAAPQGAKKRKSTPKRRPVPAPVVNNAEQAEEEQPQQQDEEEEEADSPAEPVADDDEDEDEDLGI
jgi:histone H3